MIDTLTRPQGDPMRLENALVNAEVRLIVAAEAWALHSNEVVAAELREAVNAYQAARRERHEEISARYVSSATTEGT